MDRHLITSVLGFNLKATICDKDGNEIPSGVKRSVFPTKTFKPKKIICNLIDETYFTSFNRELLEKIKNHRRLTD